MNAATMVFKRTSDFGSLEQIRHGVAHTGIDYAMPIGTPIEAVTDGIITNIADLGTHNAGKMIVLKTEDGNSVIYGHLSEFKAHVGDTVHKGDVIGLSGNTGNSTGPHLHLGLKDGSGQFIDPEKYDPAVQAMGTDHTLGYDLMHKWNEFADKVVSKEMEAFFRPLGQAIADGFNNLIDLLNLYSAELITLGVIACGLGMMVEGLFGKRFNCTGKLALVLLGGTIWRILI